MFGNRVNWQTCSMKIAMGAIVICIVGTYKQEKWPKHLERWGDLNLLTELLAVLIKLSI